ncbi:hypothetical protein I4J05_07890 [Corynebacterium diphtheriae bv. mitis]|uniref:hypothetical protein n=1 Tax=Corynebacterium diphtheriae TaxID=1717 RepID=UPI0013CAAA50|nr:hypothetical protein [Corynebacterium diphtheriae]MBG9274995.1 hypothetical protein [Corynebacterium diphtheriae bv. mitis]CAB0520760.1 hypothetical protein CIP103987_01804 [Corynebacterium diphtheriae]CAB0566375.1 hypothetical protein CIP107526_01860 [Corynebacterium diphtheriae]
MFKRSLASVAAVAIASGAVVAPANAMTMKVNNGICTFDLTDEEAKSVLLHPKAQFTKEEATASKVNVEKKLLEIRAQIEKDQAELAKDEVSDEQRKHLTSELEENKKKVTANEDFRNALTACIDGKAYNSDKSSGTDQSGDSNNPEGQGKPGGTDQSGGTEKPKVPGKPGAQPAPPSNDGAGIGVIFAGAIAAILGILAAALPIIKPMLPPQLRALLP